MMVRLALCLMLAAGATAAQAQTQSHYTRYELEADCITVATAPQNEGDWADFVCPGFGGYPFVVGYTDGREAVTYGFATEPGMPTFGPFNYANGTIEWRVEQAGDTQRPFAAIQRWHLADADGQWAREVLVVSRVGQPNTGGACALGYIDPAVAGANQRARDLADTVAEGFDCASDSPSVEAGLTDLVGAR